MSATPAAWARMSPQNCPMCSAGTHGSPCFPEAGLKMGIRTTVGASRKGRIWSHRRDRVDQLAAWCRAIGAKLLDENIDPDEVLKGTLEAQDSH